MRIAVPLDNDQNIYQHFGRATTFRLYDVEEEEILSSEDLVLNGGDHKGLADSLVELGVDAILCGNLGPEAMIALAVKDIEINGGASGKADRCVKAFLNGTLEQNDIVCDCGEGGGCSGNCGHCHH